jgi:hypothetical protein
MARSRRVHYAALVLLLTSGCANLEARKVPLADRLNGTDQKYKGFRYYLPRPYVVVSQRVCVGQHLVAGKLMRRPDGAFFLQTVDEQGRHRYLDLQGADQSREIVDEAGLDYVYYDVAALASPVQPQADKPKGKGTGSAPELESAAGTDPPDAVRQLIAGGAIPQDGVEQLRRQMTQSLADVGGPAGTPGPKGDATTPPPFQFITLPDFEEQMAIKDCNFAAKGKYELKFADGWQLRQVGGAWDATEVAVRALQVLADAVSAAGSVRQEELNKLPIPQRRVADVQAGGRAPQVLVVRVQTTYVEPGVYKLLKSSERQAPPPGQAVPPECALLADLGLPAVTDVQTYLIAP